MMRYAIPCLTLIACLFPTFIFANNTLDLALVVGNNHHLENERWDLRFADDDAIETGIHLKTILPDARLWLLSDPDEETRTLKRDALDAMEMTPATLAAWENALDEISEVARLARKDDTLKVRLFLHFSGHGQKGGALHLEDSLLPPSRFRADLARIQADEVFALMDGCHLALMIRGEEGVETIAPPSIFLEEDLALPERPPWLGLIGSTTPVPEHDYLAGGLLTRVGISGLLGPADLNGDNLITFSEWTLYIDNQIGEEQGPELVMVPPHKDWQTTVVDLSKSTPRGLRLESDFPQGQIRILEKDSRHMIAEFYHHGTRAITLHLPIGEYDVVVLGNWNTWEQSAYPASQVTVTVRTGMVSLGDSEPQEHIVMVPKNLRGPGDLPEGVTVVLITDMETRSLINSPFDNRQQNKTPNLNPSLALQWRAFSPRFGPTYSTTQTLESDPPSHPGTSLGLTYLRHPISRGRFLLSVGPHFQYGLWRESNLYDGTSTLQGGLRQEVQLGATVEESLSYRGMHISLAQNIAYAPSLITQGGHILEDSSSPSGAWRYVYTRNTAFSMALGLHWPLRSFMIGPTLKLETVRFHLSPQFATTPDPVVSWQPFISLGLDLRQSTFRRP